MIYLYKENVSRFKYISCYSLSQNGTSLTATDVNLNTSHVILYLNLIGGVLAGNAFKYISCYSLSSETMVMRKIRSYLNTSHVILYPIPGLYSHTPHAFKYISCYSLSSSLRLKAYFANI